MAEKSNSDREKKAGREKGGEEAWKGKRQNAEGSGRSGRSGNSRTVWRTAQVLCGFGVLCCIIWLGGHALALYRADRQVQELRDAYVHEAENTDVHGGRDPSGAAGNTGDTSSGSLREQQPDPTPEPDPLEGYEVPEKEIDFAGLREENPHVYAWITIPGTGIDGPVLQHPEELDYYLSHNIDGSSGKPGCIYSQLLNSQDWTDRHTVLYGHNEQKGTVFGPLHNYEDPEFFAEKPYIYVYTEEQVLVYRIFAAHESSDAHLLLTVDSSQEGWQEYLESIFQPIGINDNFDRDVELGPDSRVLTLSTCITGRWSRRWLVQAVLVAEGDR